MRTIASSILRYFFPSFHWRFLPRRRAGKLTSCQSKFRSLTSSENPFPTQQFGSLKTLANASLELEKSLPAKIALSVANCCELLPG